MKKIRQKRFKIKNIEIFARPEHSAWPQNTKKYRTAFAYEGNLFLPKPEIFTTDAVINDKYNIACSYINALMCIKEHGKKLEEEVQNWQFLNMKTGKITETPILSEKEYFNLLKELYEYSANNKKPTILCTADESGVRIKYLNSADVAKMVFEKTWNFSKTNLFPLIANLSAPVISEKGWNNLQELLDKHIKKYNKSYSRAQKKSNEGAA